MRHTDSQGRPLRYVPRKPLPAPLEALEKGSAPPYAGPEGVAPTAALPPPSLREAPAADLVARLQQLEEEVIPRGGLIPSPRQETARLQARVAQLEEEVDRLKERMAELEGDSANDVSGL